VFVCDGIEFTETFVAVSCTLSGDQQLCYTFMWKRATDILEKHIAWIITFYTPNKGYCGYHEKKRV
jgi:hypothetical protein